MEMICQFHALIALWPKTELFSCPLYKKVCGSHSTSCPAGNRKKSAPIGNQIPVLYLVASNFVTSATLQLNKNKCLKILETSHFERMTGYFRNVFTTGEVIYLYIQTYKATFNIQVHIYFGWPSRDKVYKSNCIVRWGFTLYSQVYKYTASVSGHPILVVSTAALCSLYPQECL